MSEYTMSNGTVITGKMLEMWEDMGKSESDIGIVLGISRRGLWKIRVKMGCRTRYRSDRGVDRKSMEEKCANWNAYMRNWRKRNGRPGGAMIMVGGKCVSRSRHNASMVLCRVLGDEEVVHHKDGDIRNDSYDNLVVFGSEADHLAFLRGENVVPVCV